MKWKEFLKTYDNGTSFSHSYINEKRKRYLVGICGLCGNSFECRADNTSLKKREPVCTACSRTSIPDYIENDVRKFKTIDGEVYSNVLGFEGYWINKKGEMIGRKGKKIYHRIIDKKGYEKIILKSKQKTKMLRIHRLVALAFIPNPENKPQVNHIDCNKLNNSVENLEWVTNQENHNHKMENGLNVNKALEEHSQAKLTNEQALYIKKSKEKNSVLAKRFEVSLSTIGNIKKGLSWKGLEDYDKK